MKTSRYTKISERFYIDRYTLNKAEHIAASHYHNTCEIVYFVNGEAKYFVHNQCYLVKKGSIIFVDAYEMHKALYISDKCERIVILYHPEMAHYGQLLKAPDIFAVLNKQLNGSRLITFPPDLQKPAEDLLMKMLKQYQTASRYNTIYLCSYMTVFLTQTAEYLITNNITAPASFGNTHIAAILAYINQNLGNRLTLDIIAGRLHMSKYHLCRIFKENTGLTVNNYINRRRIITAEKLIRLNKYSFTDIAHKVGYNNLTHFERVFKSITGTSPSEYSKK